MSMKAVELQFAVHKNADAGSAQQQLQHRPVQDQAQLAAQAGRQIEQARHVSAKLEQKTGAKIRDRQPDSGSKRNSGGGKHGSVLTSKAQSSLPREAADPYKGRHIDLSL